MYCIQTSFVILEKFGMKGRGRQEEGSCKEPFPPHVAGDSPHGVQPQAAGGGFLFKDE